MHIHQVRALEPNLPRGTKVRPTHQGSCSVPMCARQERVPVHEYDPWRDVTNHGAYGSRVTGTCTCQRVGLVATSAQGGPPTYPACLTRYLASGWIWCKANLAGSQHKAPKCGPWAETDRMHTSPRQSSETRPSPWKQPNQEL